MKFIVDANLPPALCAWLIERGHDATAVRDAGLRDAEDDPIWDWAVSQQAVIATKDEDFHQRRSRSESGPQILWIRIGNTTNASLFARLAGVWSDAQSELFQGHPIVEIR